MSDWRSLTWKHGFLPSTYVLDRAGLNANGREGFLPLEGVHINPVQLFFRNTQTTGIGTKYDAITTAGTSADTSVTNTTAGGTEIQATKTAGGSVVEFISGRTPVGGATFTSAVIYFWAKASVDTVNAGIRFRIYKRTNAGVETELTGSPFDSGVTLSTFNSLYEVTCNFADTALAEDDRLVFRPYLVNIGTMGVGTVTLSFNGAISAITPVAFDAVSNAAGHGGANPSSPITFSHTCSGSNRYLEVDITVGTPTAPDSDIAITGVTYNGVSLTQVPGSLVHSAGSNRGYCVKYYLVAPATGTNTVSISFTNSSPEALDAIACAAKSFNNVNQTAPFSNLVSATGTSSAPGVNATSRLGSMVSDVLVDGSAITSSGKTMRWNNDVNPNSAGGNGAGATADGASTVRMSYSGSTDDWAIVAYSINPVDGDNSFTYVFPAVTFKAEGGGTTASITESATAGESSSAIASFGVNITESAPASELASVSVSTFVNITEAVAASEASSAGLLSTGNVTESVAAAEAQSATVTHAASITETVAAAETQSAQVNFVAGITEAISADSSQSSAIITSANIIEAVTATETSNFGSASLSADITESISAADSQAASAEFNASITESITAAESSSNSMVGVASIAEAVTADSTQTASFIGNSSITESVTAAETSSATSSGASSLSGSYTNETTSVNLTSLGAEDAHSYDSGGTAIVKTGGGSLLTVTGYNYDTPGSESYSGTSRGFQSRQFTTTDFTASNITNKADCVFMSMTNTLRKGVRIVAPAGLNERTIKVYLAHFFPSPPLSVSNTFGYSSDSTTATSFALTSATYTNGKRYILSIATRTNITADPVTPTVSGASLIIGAAVATNLYDSTSASRKKQFIYEFVGNGNTGQITVDFGTQAQAGFTAILDEWTNAATATSCVVQSVVNSTLGSSLSATLGAAVTAGNATYAFGSEADPSATLTKGASLTLVGNVVGNGLPHNPSATMVKYDLGTSADFTNSSSSELGIVVLEIKPAIVDTLHCIAHISGTGAPADLDLTPSINAGSDIDLTATFTYRAGQVGQTITIDFYPETSATSGTRYMGYRGAWISPESSSAQSASITETITSSESSSSQAVFTPSITETLTMSVIESANYSTPATITESSSADSSQDSSLGSTNLYSDIEEIFASDELSVATYQTNSNIIEITSVIDASFTYNIIVADVTESVNLTDTYSVIVKLVKRAVSSVLAIRDLGTGLVKRVLSSNLTERDVDSNLTKRDVDSNLDEREP